mmetsp:Transcript_44857/g.100803  ORF Transcript_44857/g.100803 Transcript_44857/m.100803 type:complete len:88 (+) Transcript_44857:190-453(+)
MAQTRPATASTGNSPARVEKLAVPVELPAVPPDGQVFDVLPPPHELDAQFDDEHGVLQARSLHLHASGLLGSPDARGRLLMVGTAAE